ncbi:AbrB/MazE/SpoVT family DNA-binding domain-containing protein [Lichenihabitans sp. Uapishka_5]|uniref:AbrB/MazE/SpoVT family DNA-binding domain-containing protein n=1 Tax=Lichenihabitans sp. Uapishka_5 TaxID=3037302 RepID=UPI0029E8187C|nr:AbrB/MazE/SpoVT family DNA-binding domain-containing protein [Lichenihabitans sp. Uapishka_5]MDX7953136.1 AbrB/MazE/SpoVT family DNA-binding domain-containing protein [Lichenihabitans sp. Uapishka_5]
MTREIARLAEGGRIVVPARIRKALALDKGDAVWLNLVDGELRIRPARSALKRIQQHLLPFAPGRPPSDELVADRRIEAARDGG